MKDIQVLKTFELNADLKAGKDKEVKELFNGSKRRLVEVKTAKRSGSFQRQSARADNGFLSGGKRCFPCCRGFRRRTIAQSQDADDFGMWRRTRGCCQTSA